MTTESIWSRVRRRPFAPFRLRTSDGSFYDIHHPEMILLSKNSITLAIYDGSPNPNELPSREIFVSPLHVTVVEDLPARASA